MRATDMNHNKLRIFQGAVAIITGGASGIGKALGQELARRGAEVILADLQLEEAQLVARDIIKQGGVARGLALDVTDFEATKALVAEVLKASGRVDYYFNNAGIAIGGLAENYEINDWERIIEVNLTGVTNGIQAVYRPMIEQGFGHIINTASITGLLPSPVIVGYAATKHAVVGLSKALRIEAERHGIRVSVVCPGVVRTPILTGGKFGKLSDGLTPDKALELWKKLGPIAPDIFALRVIKRIAKNHGVIIEPFEWRVITTISRWFPGLANFMARREFRRVLAAMKEGLDEPS
jgi:NAD(P)-dependent dehydrogenase (short-subunit alcohol dehydrogenase family)